MINHCNKYWFVPWSRFQHMFSGKATQTCWDSKVCDSILTSYKVVQSPGPLWTAREIILPAPHRILSQSSTNNLQCTVWRIKELANYWSSRSLESRIGGSSLYEHQSRPQWYVRLWDTPSHSQEELVQDPMGSA